MAQNPVFTAYALTVVVNSLNLLVLWNLSGGTRGGTKTTPNPEDALTVSKGAAVVESDPASVARVLRAQRNSFDNTIPFLILGAVFSALGPNPLEAQIIFGAFTGMRLFYSVAYLKALQPWRTISYAVGVFATLALMVEICRLTLS
jgi:prostaglandin-E synthase 1